MTTTMAALNLQNLTHTTGTGRLIHRPARGATDGQRIPRNAGEPREAASQGVGLQPGQGRAAFTAL